MPRRKLGSVCNGIMREMSLKKFLDNSVRLAKRFKMPEGTNYLTFAYTSIGYIWTSIGTVSLADVL